MEANNMKAVREALDYCRDMVADLIHHIGHDEDYLEREMKELVAKCNTALSAPPRNCDRPECKDIQSAMNVYRRECCEDGPLYARKEGAMHEAEWLLAPATEKEGGNDGK